MGGRARNLLGAAVASATLVAGLLATVPAAAEEPTPGLGHGLVDGLAGAKSKPGDRAGSRGPRGRAEATPIRRTAVISDASETSPTAQPGQLLSRVSVTQELQTGVLRVSATLQAVPTTDSFLYVGVGDWHLSTCQPRAMLAATTVTDTADAGQGVFVEDGAAAGQFSVDRSRSGATITLRSTSHAATFRTADYACAFAYVTQPGEDPHQRFYSEHLEEEYPARLTFEGVTPVQGSYRGKWTTVRFDVRNQSKSAASDVVVRPQGKGLQFKPKVRRLGKIDQKSAKYGVTFRARVTAKKANQRKATFVARTGSHSSRSTVTIAVTPRPSKYKSLAGRYFWGWKSGLDQGWDNRAIWFVDRRWVHTDFAPNGRKPTCSKKNPKCKRYTYNARTGKVKVGGRQFKVNTEGLPFAASKKESPVRYYPTTLAKKNQRFNVSLMRNDFTGTCGIWCNTWTEWLTMDKKGRFVLSRVSYGSLGGPGGPGTVWGSVSPDHKGTYKVGKHGQVTLKFANGKTERHTLAIEHDARRKPNPGGQGLILGERNFYVG